MLSELQHSRRGSAALFGQFPRGWWNFEAEQFNMCRLMSGQSGCDRRSPLHPTMTKGTHGQLQTQAVMKVAEVVEASHNRHACHQSLGSLRQGRSAMRQSVDTVDTVAKSSMAMSGQEIILHRPVFPCSRGNLLRKAF